MISFNAINTRLSVVVFVAVVIRSLHMYNYYK